MHHSFAAFAPRDCSRIQPQQGAILFLAVRPAVKVRSVALKTLREAQRQAAKQMASHQSALKCRAFPGSSTCQLHGAQFQIISETKRSVAMNPEPHDIPLQLFKQPGTQSAKVLISFIIQFLEQGECGVQVVHVQLTNPLRLRR